MRQAIMVSPSWKIITEPILTRSFPFDKYSDAYKFIENMGERSMKVMIDL